eukprot:7304861-Prymnesium_polylepis.2
MACIDYTRHNRRIHANDNGSAASQHKRRHHPRHHVAARRRSAHSRRLFSRGQASRPARRHR